MRQSRFRGEFMKVAAVQMDVRILDKDRNVKKVLEYLREAARDGAKLVVFPECALTGYCFTSLEEAWPVAETVPGPSSMTLAAIAKELDATAVVGLLEREGDRLYNAAVVVGPRGVLGTYRKVHLPFLGGRGIVRGQEEDRHLGIEHVGEEASAKNVPELPLCVGWRCAARRTPADCACTRHQQLHSHVQQIPRPRPLQQREGHRRSTWG